MNKTLNITLAGLLLCTAMACEEPSRVTVEEDPVDPNMPPARVDLPSPPPASGFEVQEKYPDGNLRVEGLIHYQDKHLEQKVNVKGVILKISEPCDPKKAQKKDEKCPEPSLFIRDEPDSQKIMRMVGFKDDFIKKAKIAEGDMRVFKGTYSKVAYGFVATEDGLVLLDYIDEHSVVEPEK